jgi:hypothetical protein
MISLLFRRQGRSVSVSSLAPIGRGREAPGSSNRPAWLPFGNRHPPFFRSAVHHRLGEEPRVKLAANGSDKERTNRGGRHESDSPGLRSRDRAGAVDTAWPRQGGTVERLYILNCGEGIAGDISRWSPGVNVGKSMDFVDNCYLIKHAQGWMLWDTGLADAIATCRRGSGRPIRA